MSDTQKSPKTQVKVDAVKPMAALQGYLDDMLSVATEAVAREEVEVSAVVEAVVKTEVAVEATEISEPVTPETDIAEHTSVEPAEVVVAELVIEQPLVEPEKQEPPVLEDKVVEEKIVEESVVELQPVMELEPEEQVISESSETVTTLDDSLTARALSPDGELLPYPNWAASGFECLLFYVGGIKLAVPLILLGGIHRIDKELTPLFGQPEWFLGLFPRTTMEGQQNIRVVHTSKWVMPEKQAKEIDPLNHYVISLGDSDWGLLSHQLSDSIRLSHEQVKWRTDAGKRPWLAGTVIDHMCAILDVNSMVTLLNDNSKRIN